MKDRTPRNSFKLRRQAEALARERAARAPEADAALSPEEIQKRLHALRVHEIELEMQNEELRTAQAQIEAGRARYFDLYDLAPVGYCTLSEKGLILEANLTAATLLGIARGALVKQPISRFIFKEDQDVFYLSRKRLLERCETQECELRLVKPDGTNFWAHLSATAAHAEDGAPVCRAVISDISGRKQAEEELRSMVERYRFANEATNDVVWDWDIVNDSQRWNASGAVVFGWTDIVAAPQTGAWWLERVHPEDQQRVDELFFAAVQDPGTGRWRDEYRFRKADGAYAYVVDRGYILRDADGRAVRMIGAMLDITERKRVEDALRSSRQLLDATEALIAVGGWEWDVATQAMTWTDGTYRIHDWDPTALPPGSPEHIPQSLACYDPGDRPRVEEAFWKCVEAGEAYDLECGFTTTKGRRLRVRTMGRAIRENGRVVKVLGNIQDITEQKRAEVEKEKLQAQLQQAQKMEAVGRLAGGVAHDFNNMLGIIIGHADMLLEEMGPDQPFHADLAEIRKAGERSADLTRQLLAFARKQTVAPKVIDLNECVEGMRLMLRRLIGEDIDMDWIPGKQVWSVRIDPAQILQILANLCVNARDAIADVGKVTIETENIVFDEEYCNENAGSVPGEYVLMTVSDNGCGMNSEALSHLFEPFYTTKEMGKGTGLGLATVYGVVMQNNGLIHVDSEPGQGTTFKIYLPRHRDHQAPKPDQVASQAAARGHETILLVEDEPAILRMTAMMLERGGYCVLPAATPGEAMRLAREHAGEIHLLMADVVMPEMNGRDLARTILCRYPHMKCLFMSGYPADVIAHHGVLDKGVNFIEKPFSKSDLIGKVRAVLDRD